MLFLLYVGLCYQMEPKVILLKCTWQCRKIHLFLIPFHCDFNNVLKTLAVCYEMLINKKVQLQHCGKFCTGKYYKQN